MSDFQSVFFGRCAAQHLADLQLITSQPGWSVYQACLDSQPSEKRLIKLLTLHPDNAPSITVKEIGHIHQLTHPNILGVFFHFDFLFNHDYFLAIVCEHAETSLEYEIMQMHNASTPYPEWRILQMAAEVASALVHMKNSNLAHRNVIPTNIYLSQSSAKLTDFLCIREGAEDRKARASIIGTSLFWAPELQSAFSSSELTVSHNVYKSDVYALGLTLLSMTCLASKDEMAAIVAESSMEAAIDRVDYSERVKLLLRGMLRGDESLRLSAEEIFQITNTQTCVFFDRCHDCSSHRGAGTKRQSSLQQHSEHLPALRQADPGGSEVQIPGLRTRLVLARLQRQDERKTEDGADYSALSDLWERSEECVLRGKREEDESVQEL